MAYITVPKIQRSNTSTSVEYDILNDDATLLAQLKAIESDFPTQPLAMNVDVFLPEGGATQIKINGGEWQDFMAGASYGLDNITNVNSVLLSATGIVYTVSISFE